MYLNKQKMEGIHYLTDGENKRIAVQIDLSKYGKVWEDIRDVLIAESRKKEESTPWEEVKKSLGEGN